jgi:hypothetical protein
VSKIDRALGAQKILVQITCIGIAALFPIALVTGIIGKLDLGYPLYPLIAPFALGHELEGKPSLRRDGDIVHLIGHENIVIYDVFDREGCCISIIGVENDHFGFREGTNFFQYFLDLHAFPEYINRPALDAVQCDYFIIFGEVVNDFVIGITG